MTQEAIVNHEELSLLMIEAASGDREALRAFYQNLLTKSFYVPERYQRAPLDLQPEYPNDFINVLAVKESERTFVPVFTTAEGITDWFGESLSCSLISGKKLIERLPEDWWILVNPQSEIYKELSPWELAELTKPDGIESVIEDIIPTLVKERTYLALSEDLLSKIEKPLSLFAGGESDIQTISALQEDELDEDGRPIKSSLVIGIEVSAQHAKSLDSIIESVKNTIKPQMIGDLDLSVVAGISKDSLALSIFRDHKPIFARRHTKSQLSLTFVDLLSMALLAAYGYLFWQDLSPYWFNPKWITDDAMQQVYVFHEALYPGLFEGDLITDVMRGYLAPLHYWLSYGITLLTGDPVMMSHWVMLIQFLLTCGFIFFAVKKVSAVAPAALAVLWFVHTRPMIQRMTGGLPRGWALPVLAAYLYFILSKNHWGVLVVILCGCLLHPPATLTISIAYGLFLLWRIRGGERQTYKKHLLRLAIFAPLFTIITLYVISKPDSIGEMVSYETAALMPEFRWPDGRFPFVPLRDISEDLMIYGFQPFMNKLYRSRELVRGLVPLTVLGLFFVFTLVSLRRKRDIIPAELGIYFVAVCLSYSLARIFAFKLYVPNRHLQYPMTIFLITAITIGIWRLVCDGAVRSSDSGVAKPKGIRWGCGRGFLSFLPLALLVYLGSGDGLNGSANFNYYADKKGRAFSWVRSNTDRDALVAGHPTHINGLSLFGVRRAYATVEIAHPFFPKYYSEIERRLIISLKAHYARSDSEFLELVEPEGIDYFIFSRKRFYPEALRNESMYAPLNELVKALTAYPPTEYLYKKLPSMKEKPNYVVFRDHESVIVDVRALSAYLNAQK